MFVTLWDMDLTEKSMGQFSTKFHGSKWNIFPVMDAHRNGPLRNGGNFRPIFFHKNSHILQKVSQNVLKCNWIVITVAMPLLNIIEVFVWVVYCGFAAKNIIFIIFHGSTAFFRAVALKPNLCNLKTLFLWCVAIFCNRKSYQDVGDNFARLGPWPRDYVIYVVSHPAGHGSASKYQEASNSDLVRLRVCEFRECFKNAYEFLNLRALKISMLYKNHVFQCMGKIFCVEFQSVALKVHTKYLTHTLKDVNSIHNWFKSSKVFLKRPPSIGEWPWARKIPCSLNNPRKNAF